VLTTAEMVLTPELAAVATGQRISYVSSDPDDKPIVVTGAILTPRLQKHAKHDVVAWAHGTEGLADQCAPSRFATLSSDPAFPLYGTTVTSLVTRGWTVAATDYAGLGSPGPHPYLIGDSEGRAIIDSVRAARQLNRSLSKDWVAMGHSQGGQGALFAGEQARDYGRGLRLQGVVGQAAASDLDQLAAGIVGTPGQGYLVMALSGLAAVDPAVRPTRLLAWPALSRTHVLESGCFMDIIGEFADLTADELLVGGALPPQIVERFAVNNPGQRQGHAPILLQTGEADDTVPPFVADNLLAAYCAKDTAIAVQKYAGSTHDLIVIDASTDALAWIDDRFGGDPAPNHCPTATR
jgi:acetyl esterase/lipase